MTWLLELPSDDGEPMLVNMDAPIVARATVAGDGCEIHTQAGRIVTSLSYDQLCERLRLNPRDRMPVQYSKEAKP